MSPAEQKYVMNAIVRKIAAKLDIQIEFGFNLRTARAIKRTVAQTNKTWTLFINRKGSLCHAFYKNGAFLVLESPEHLHDCFHEEYAANYFINQVRSMTAAMHSA